MGAMVAATSTFVKLQQPVLCGVVLGARIRTSRAATASVGNLRLTGTEVVALRSTLWPSARGLRDQSSVVAAGGGESGDEESNKEIEISGDEKSEETEILDVVHASDGEEVAALLEPPADSIDEGYVKELNDGDSYSSSDSSSDSGSESEDEYDAVDVKEFKQQLIDSLYGTERGVRASSDTRAEVIELISQLESKNRIPAPTAFLSLLNGNWILVYTSYSELYPLLAAGNLPLVKVAEVSQTIDLQALSIENSVLFESPVATTSFTTSASFEIRSPKRIQVKLEEGIISSPKLKDSVEIPSKLNIMGQQIDLSFAKGLLKPLQDVAMAITRNLSGQPPLKFSIQNDRAQSWLLTTFLDKDLRISRSDGGSVFIFLREGSTLLY